MELKEQFEKAAAGSKALPEKPSNDILLKLYALYKQATEGDVATESPSTMFDFVNKAKHHAWSNLKGKPKEEAMKEYIEIITKLKS